MDAELLKLLMVIADSASDDLHMIFWGESTEPLHFSLTKNQKDTKKLFVVLYLGDQIQFL